MGRKRGDGAPFVRTTIALDQHDLEAMRKIAHQERVPVTTWMRDALVEAVSAYKAQKRPKKVKPLPEP
jgi:hypothetical protein